MNLQDDLHTNLERMGGTADEVAATVRAKGVQGVRNTVRLLNPVVRYVQNILRIDNLDLDVMTGKTIRANSGSAVKMQELPLPEPVREFLDAFNRGAYPDLELPPEKK
jgi:hypothetical protein